jgi:subtilisin family serine protease
LLFMKKSKIFSYTVILLILVSSNFLIPFIGMGIDYSNNMVNSIGKNQRINTNQVNEAFSKYNPTNSDKNQIRLDRKTSLFGDDLESYLMELNAQSEKISGKIKLIITFRDQIGKEVRLDYLDSIFNNYEVIYNYDVIAGVYLEVDLYELLENYELLKNDGLVIKMYKSKAFQAEIPQNDFMAANPLNASKYENWWHSAVGADDLEYDGSGVRVAVVDSGIYSDHPDLDVAMEYDFVDNDTVAEDNNGHGTHVSGIVASSGESSGGKYAGIAPGVELIHAKAGNSTGSLVDANILRAIEWSAKPIAEDGAGADIISMSFGGGFPFAHEPLASAITSISRQYDVIMVASAGNSGPDYFTGSVPAAGVSIISVGATDKSNNLGSFSSWGPSTTYIGYPDVAAPGVNIFSTLSKDSIIGKTELFVGDYVDYQENGDYIPLSGTSMSCPMVSGALALIMSAYPEISVETARIALMEGAKDLPDNDDDEVVRSGIGLINVKASLDYLEELTNKNDVAKIFPDSLPVKPYTLLNFPGDRQRFNLSVFVGDDTASFSLAKNETITGINVQIDDSQVSSTGNGVRFGTIDIRISKDCYPGIKTFQVDLKKGGTIYDSVYISFEVKLPENKILMESYHGTTDWFPSLSYSQIGYYEAMIDMAGLNNSIDYQMDYWTPDYNSTTDATILTEEKLAQYDLLVLQTPFLPFSPLEINNVEQYFNNGGNILFLGTRHKDLAAENINYLLDDAGIRIKGETVAEVEENGLGASIYIQNVSLDAEHEIFNNVDQFLWGFGNTFEVSGNAESIAEINGKTVAAAYDGTSAGAGKMVAFGDHHWMHTYYTDPNFEDDHKQLLKNVMNYLIPEREVSLSIELNEYRTSDGTFEFSVYAKYQDTNLPVTSSDLSSGLDIKIGGIGVGLTTTKDGIATVSYSLGSTSPDPVLIEAELTLESTLYKSESKVLYYDLASIPVIQSLKTSATAVTRESGQSLNIIADLDRYLSNNFNAYLSLFTYSFFNERKTVNDTVQLTSSLSSLEPSEFSGTFDPEPNDPAGYGVFYIIPKSFNNYINPNSPRSLFLILDYAPRIVEDQSFFDYGEGDIVFDDTYSDQGSQIYQVSQGMDVNFSVEARDREDDSSDLKVFVILFMALITRNNSLSIMLPSTIISESLPFREGQDHHSGIFKVPAEMEFSSIEGLLNVSTATDFTPNTGGDYLALYYINVIDQDGGSIDQPFAIILSIEPGFNISSFWIVLLVIGGIVGVIIIITKTRKSQSRKSNQSKRDEVYFQPATKESSYYGKSREESEPQSQSKELSFCPNCGEKLKSAKRFCPNCGEKLPFK